MYISSLTLTDFRNYSQEKIEFSPGTNLIYGNNAQGKTNILEAVYLFAHGRSHRAKTDKELIRFGCEFASLTADFHDAVRDYSANIRLIKNGKKNITINHVKINKLSMLMNYLNAVMFSPEDLELVKGSPSSRRRFIDSAISQLYPGYLVSLIEYNKALLQKNSLLKAFRSSPKNAYSMLEVWNEQLAQTGSKIMDYRIKFIASLNEFACIIQKEISDEKLNIQYLPGIKTDNIDKETLFDFLQNRCEREIEIGSAQYGIQRDDISISINDREAKTFGSQGQQRTAALSLKIAQADYIKSIKDEYPVLLLDDILSELDYKRRMYLLEKIKDKQVLITGTDSDLKTNVTDTVLFYAENGTITKQQ